MFELIKSGGFLMWPILLCSVLALAIICERFWTLRPQKIIPANLNNLLASWIKNREWHEGRLATLRQHSPLGFILSEALRMQGKSYQSMKEAITRAGSEVVHSLERYLNALGTIATIAPLLGLLGTVVGMIQVFSVIVEQGVGNANALSGGISKALITTAAGLTVAIPAVMFHRFFERRIDKLAIGLEQATWRVLNNLPASSTGFPSREPTKPGARST